MSLSPRVLAASPVRRPGVPSSLRRLSLLVAIYGLAASPGFGQFPGGLAHRPVSGPFDYEAPPSTAEARRLWLDFYADEALLQRDDDLVIADAYLAILRRWAAAPTPTNLALLAEFEARLDRSDRCFETIQDRNLETMNGLAPGALAPALILHVYSWRRHLEHDRFNFLAGTARRVVRWAEWHAESAPNPERARRQAAGILTRLGG
ncbi:MAG: hypothetical protein AAGF23_25630, partial [Acidobacteriota bacterium]